MKRYLNHHLLSIMVIVIVSLIPLLWYGNNLLILGHDTGWTLNPIDRFIDRLYPWTHTGFGYDQSLEMGTVTIYMLPAALSFMGFSFIAVQKLTYIFWFLAMGLASYFCVTAFFKNKYSYLIALSATVFLLINHYVLQAWTVAELSKFSAIVLFLVGLGCIWRILDNNKSSLKYTLIFGITAFFFNGGGGSGIPLYAGFFLIFMCLFFYEWLVAKKSIFKIIQVYFFFTVAYSLVNLYWLIPLADVITSQYSPFSTSGGPQSAVAWTNVISANTSFLNLFRLQGFSGWYDEPTHPYASVFLSNPILIMISLFFPILAILSIILTKDKQEKKVIVFFLLMLLLSVIFAAGTHPPFGDFYKFLMTHVFGFAIFRTAFYKFGYVLWFSYGVLVSYTVVTVCSRLKKIGLIVGVPLMMLIIGMYNYPYFSGQFFNIFNKFTTRIEVPEYIPHSANYINSLPQNSRIILLPPPSPVNGQTDIYKFGYFSRTPLPFQVTQKSVVSNLEINTVGQSQLAERFYSAFENGEEEEVLQLLQEMGITHVLLRNDVQDKNAQYPIVSPLIYKQKLNEYSWINHEKTIGDWEFYSIKNASQLVSAVSPSFTYVSGELSALIKATALESGTLFVSSDNKNLPKGNNTVISKCTTCEISGIQKLPSALEIKIYPTSPFYFVSKQNEEKNLRNSIGDPWVHFGYLYFYAEKHSIELQRLAEPYIDNSNLKADQEQRYQIMKTYENTLRESFETFLKLSDTQKLSAVNEYVTSLQKQRQRLKDISKSKFFNEINSLYLSSYSLINSILEDSKITSALTFKELYNTFEVTIPQSGIYSFQSVPLTSELLLNGEVVPLTNNEIGLKAGKQRLDTKKDDLAIFYNEKILLNSENGEYSTVLSDLLPNTQYQIILDFDIKGSPGLMLQIIDSFGEKKVDALLEQIGSNPVKKYTANFSTGNASPVYILRLYAERDFAEDRNVEVSNLSIRNNSQPYIILKNEQEAKTTQVPELEYHYVNPANASVSVKDAKEPYVVLFKESFSPFWEASINGERQIKSFQANAAFNAWYIEKLGNYTIKLEYIPDKKNKYTKILSLIFISCFTIVLSYLLLKELLWKK